MNMLLQSKLLNQTSRSENPTRFNIKPTLAELCLRQPLPKKSNSEEWMMKSFASFSQANSDKKSLTRKSSLQMSLVEPIRTIDQRQTNSGKNNQRKSRRIFDSFSRTGTIQTNDEHETYKEIVIKQHAVPYTARLSVEFV